MTGSSGRPAPAGIGDPVETIDTPALVVDLQAMTRNLEALAAWAAGRGVALRPHAKMHKSADVGALQMAAGAVGLCVQKLSEAEALVAAADAGAPRLPDLLLTNEVIDPAKLDRLAALARRVRLGVVVDSDIGVDRLAEALARAAAVHPPAPDIAVLVEIDVGHGRCGVAPHEAGALARRLVDRGLRFAGLQAYHGSAQHLRSPADRAVAVASAAEAVRAARRSLAAAGLPCPCVTGGGTGTLAADAAAGTWDELQAGSYLFMDRDYADNEASADAPRFEPALFVKTRVISRGPARAVIDAGHKAHAVDSGPPRVAGRFAGLAWTSGGDEHGLLSAPPDRPGASLPAIGETVWLQPGHCDPTVNLHDVLVVINGGLDQGRVTAIWPVHARGCLT